MFQELPWQFKPWPTRHILILFKESLGQEDLPVHLFIVSFEPMKSPSLIRLHSLYRPRVFDQKTKINKSYRPAVIIIALVWKKKISNPNLLFFFLSMNIGLTVFNIAEQIYADAKIIFHPPIF